MIQDANNKDLRFLKTREVIHDAFRSLLQKMPYEKITVKLLAEEARINRKTFYLHYNTLDDLLMECRLEIVSTGVNRLLNFIIPQDLKLIIYTIFTYWQSLTEDDDRIWRSSSDGGLTFFQQMQIQYTNFAADYFADNHATRQIVLAFVVRGIGIIYHEWTTNYPNKTIDEAVELAYGLISKGIEGIK